MRIAMVGNFGFAYLGTMAARALPIARELARRGHRVEIFVPADGSALPEATSIDGVIIRSCVAVGRGKDRLKLRLLDGKRGTDALAGRSAIFAALEHTLLGVTITWEALRSYPDVLYAFKPIGYSGMALTAGWALRQIQPGYPLLVLDSDDWEGTGGWADRKPGSRFRSRLVDVHERWCLNHADLVTVASRELDRLVRPTSKRSLYLPNAASMTSPGWTPGQGAAFRASINTQDAPIVLAYTRFLEFAPRLLVDVFEKIVDQVPAVQLVVAGKGLDGEEETFSRLISERGLRDRVHLLGWTRLADLPNVFAAADVALYPLDDTRLNRAKCPMKLVDLLLAGVPVVADRVGQAAEYIIDGATGYLVQPGVTSAMAERVTELLQDRQKREHMGSAARQNLLSEWTWTIRAAALDAALRTYGSERGR